MAKGKKAAAAALSDADYHALAEFRCQLRRFLVFSEEAARGEGLQPQQHQALLAIRGFGGVLTIGELADKLMIRPHTAAELAERLARAGHVRKEADAWDRRRTRLTLTPVAQRHLVRLSQAHREELERLVPLMKPLMKSLKRET
jgi:DNA-binding MarR family transcriptional regulator